METAAASWAVAELGGANLGDARLNRRLVRVAERLGAQPGASIPVACGGWAETQPADDVRAVDAVAGVGRRVEQPASAAGRLSARRSRSIQ